MKESLSKSVLAAMESRLYRLKKTYDKINVIITPSAFYKKKLEEANITNTKIIHMKNFLPSNTNYSDEIVIGDYFLYFGRLSKEKGILTLLKAYKMSKVDRPLFIVGTGPMETTIKKEVVRLQLCKKVKVLGYKQGQELKDLVKNSRCVILPSEWYENGPYSIMEAQAAGKPCIVSDIGGLPEIVENQSEGYVVLSKNIDSLCKAMKTMDQLDYAQLEQMAIMNRNNSRDKYLIDEYYTNLMDIYEEWM